MNRFSSLFLTVVFSVPLYISSGESAKAINFIIPVKTEHPENKITSVFGESRGDHFHNGLDIYSINETVKSLADGTVIYTEYNGDSPFSQEMGSGNSVWIYHKDGILSSYYHLRDGRNPRLLAPIHVKQGEPIGITGNTGHSTGAHLHFVVMDHFGNRILDPSAFLPPLSDDNPPDIRNLFVHVGEKSVNVNDGDNINVSKPLPVTILITDSANVSGQIRGIASAEYWLNGKRLKEVSFDSLEFKNGKWINPEGFTFDDLFYRSQYYLGDLHLVSGENKVLVKVKDFLGNQSEREFRFNVNRI